MLTLQTVPRFEHIKNLQAKTAMPSWDISSVNAMKVAVVVIPLPKPPEAISKVFDAYNLGFYLSMMLRYAVQVLNQATITSGLYLPVILMYQSTNRAPIVFPSTPGINRAPAAVFEATIIAWK
jgi:hypothetical protein